MSAEAGRPDDDLRRVEGAQARFLAVIADLTDVEVAEPSLLPDWTIGHVLAHVARNADSHVRRTEAALRGELVDQYPGGYAGRAAEIERDAGGTAEQLRADVAASADELARVWSTTPDEVWERVTRDVGGRERPLRMLVSRRWQELEVHVVDLGRRVTHRDWPEDFVAAWLPRLRAGVAERLPHGAGRPGAGTFDEFDERDERDELAWLYGRLTRPDLPDLLPWA